MFSTFYDDCRKTINTVYDVAGDDKTHDGNAGSFQSFNQLCDPLPRPNSPVSLP